MKFPAVAGTGAEAAAGVQLYRVYMRNCFKIIII
jgi:hypothetical protein